MHFKTTIFLLLLSGGCVALFWKGPELAPRLGLASKPSHGDDEGTNQALARLPVEKITEVEIQAPDQAKVVLKAAAAGQPLELPGNWPIRRSEVDELLRVLHDLRSRYYPISIDHTTDLKQYGLADDQKPLMVKITSADAAETLRFGEAPVHPGENPFTRATYVRMEGKNEILRLGPHVLPILRRNEETYRRRQLFPEAIRERIAQPKVHSMPGMPEEPAGAAQPTFLLSDAAKRIVIDTPSGRLVLQREAPLPKPEAPADKPDDDPTLSITKLAETWDLVEPVHDRIDPEKLRAILTSIPSLWLEKFVDSPQAPDVLYGLGSSPDFLPQLFTMLGGSIPTGIGETPLSTIINVASLKEARSGHARITIDMQDGSKRTLQIGRVSRAVGGDEYRFAKLEDNPLVFELKADKLSDLQINFSRTRSGSPVDDLRDPVLVRFETSQVNGVAIEGKAGKADRMIQIEKMGDEWNLQKPFQEQADRAEVEGLLKVLKDMEARSGNIIDGTLPQTALIGGLGTIDAKVLLGLTGGQMKKITLSFDARSGKKPATFLIGKRDSRSSKRAVMIEGWTRINLVNDAAEADQASRLDRAPSSFRMVKLFDRLRSKIGELVIQRAATAKHPVDSVTLQEQPGSPPKWTITAPFKAEIDREVVNPLTNDLLALDTRKYVYDPKTDDPLMATDMFPRFLLISGALASAIDPTGDAFFGLDKPTLTLSLKFTEPKGAEDVVIEVGRQRSPTENYARRKGTTGLFVVPAALVKLADNKPEDLVDRTMIQLGGNAQVQAIRRSMNGQELEITQNNSALWDITKPIMARADQISVDELAKQLSQLRAVRIETLVPKDLKTYGLDKPLATVTVEALDRNKIVEKVISIGSPVDPAKPDGDHYIKADNASTVAVIPGTLARQLLAGPFKFRDLTLGGFISADKIVFDSGARKITFAKGPTGWKVKEPLEANAEDEELRELHDIFAKFRADEFVEDKPGDLAKYGLDKPTHWKVFNGDKELIHLLVGAREKVGQDKQTDGARAYAMLAKGGTVVLLSPAMTSILSSELRQRSLWPALPEKDIAEITIKSADGMDVFTLKRGPLGWMDASRPTEQLNKKLVDDLLLTIEHLRIERYVVDTGAVDLKPYGLDKPKTITIAAEGGRKHTLLLGNLFEGKRFYAKLDDSTRSDVFLFNEEDSRVLNRTRAAYSLKPKEEPKKEEPKKEEPKKEQPKKENLKKDVKKEIE